MDSMMVSQTDFNPRTRRGCDGKLSQVFEEFAISIHAPVEGATGRIGALNSMNYISIHAPVEGATYKLFSLSLFSLRFQSTHP